MSTFQLERITVAGFRSLRELTLELTPITVLVGANGAGKSNLLQVLRMVQLIRTQSLRRFVGEQGGASALLHYGASTTRELEFELTFIDGQTTCEYAAFLGFAAGDSFIFRDELVSIRPADPTSRLEVSMGAGHTESLLPSRLSNNTNDHPAPTVNTALAGVTYYHFHDTSPTSPLRQNSTQADNRFLRSDGSNLAAFLHRLRTSVDDEVRRSWALITSVIHRIAPFIKELQPDLVIPENPNGSPVHLYWLDERDRRCSSSDFSDGTLRAIALVAALAQPSSTLPTFMSIDEPELGLHPLAIGLIASLVRSISPRCRVMLSTQSSALMDYFEPNEIVVVERSKGESTFRRLSSEDLHEWLNDYTLSQLYDKNLLGGRP